MTSNPLRVARGTAAALSARALKTGEIAQNTDNERLHIGDGTTVSGLPLAFLSDVEGLETDGDTIEVTATGSVTERTLAARFSEVRNVKDFGATGDGTTDDYTAIAAAIAALPTRGGVVFFPPGDYAHSQVIQVGNGTSSLASTTQNIMLLGQTVPNGEITTINNATRLKYTGSAAAANIRINGPITCAVIGFHLDSNFLTDGGIYATHAFFSRFEDLYVGKYMGSAFKLDSYNSHAQCTIGANDNRWINIHCAQPGANASTPFEIGNAVKAAGVLGTSRNLVSTFSFKGGNHATGRGVVLRHCDIITFENGLIHSGVGASSNVAKLVEIAPPTGSTSFPQAITFRNVAIICDGVDDYEISASWTADYDDDAGVQFIPFLKADTEGATNPIPNHPLFYGVTDEGEFFGKWKYQIEDLAGHRSVISSTTTAQPGSPAFEDIYIIPASATGALWSTFAVGSFAQYRGQTWAEIPAREGFTAYVKDQDRIFAYNGSAWATRTPTVQVFTASGTYTKPTGVTAIIVEVRGSGGGGGGVSNAAGALAAAGGGQGGYARERLAASVVGATETVTIGAVGAGGSTAGGNGTAGGASSFGSHCSANGGNGGVGAAAAATTAPGLGGTATGGDVNFRGQAGCPGVSVTGIGPASGTGGGEGAGNGRVTTGAGIAGLNGGGGGGAASAGGTTANLGGDGGAGYVIVTEFYS